MLIYSVIQRAFQNNRIGAFHFSESALKKMFVSKLRNNFNAIVYHITNNNNQLIFTKEY